MRSKLSHVSFRKPLSSSSVVWHSVYKADSVSGFTTSWTRHAWPELGFGASTDNWPTWIKSLEASKTAEALGKRLQSNGSISAAIASPFQGKTVAIFAVHRKVRALKTMFMTTHSNRDDGALAVETSCLQVAHDRTASENITVEALKVVSLDEPATALAVETIKDKATSLTS